MSVTTPRGFRAAGACAGLKPSGKADLSLVVNDGPLHLAAGRFTSNRVKAAPVLWSEQIMRTGTCQAVILNSGGANACTGPDGFADTHRTAESVAEAMGIGAIDVAVCSTGLIGERLPMDKITSAIPALAANLTTEGGPDAARAIMTTDTVPKTAVYEADGWSIGGMAKGAGMLAPGLATMLVVITTDAVVEPAALGDHLARACSVSFERIDSDGCMSTNDTVLLLSSGASGITVDDDEFEAALAGVCLDLALQLIDDAEGAAHTVAIAVHGAATVDDAVEVGRTVARSNLLKCAIFGRDPNWGRVLSAIGTTSAAFQADQLDVSFNGVRVCRAGRIGEPRSLVDLTPREVRIGIDLHAGSAEATVWTNDLTYDYVKENAEYST